MAWVTLTGRWLNWGSAPLPIGIGLQSSPPCQYVPQPEDVALNVVLTEAGVRFHREGM